MRKFQTQEAYDLAMKEWRDAFDERRKEFVCPPAFREKLDRLYMGGLAVTSRGDLREEFRVLLARNDYFRVKEWILVMADSMEPKLDMHQILMLGCNDDEMLAMQFRVYVERAKATQQIRRLAYEWQELWDEPEDFSITQLCRELWED